MQDIYTPRLTIRRFSETDAAGLFEYLANPRVNCFLDEKVVTLEQAKMEAKKRSQDESCVAVCLKETGELIGDLFLYKEDRLSDKPNKEASTEELLQKDGQQAKNKAATYSVGWNFNERFEGKGYASESAKALFDYLFMQAGARRLYAYVEDDNFKSQKLCEKLGMRKEGCFIAYVSFINYPDGTPKYENTFQYAILKKEWLLKDR